MTHEVVEVKSYTETYSITPGKGLPPRTVLLTLMVWRNEDGTPDSAMEESMEDHGDFPTFIRADELWASYEPIKRLLRRAVQDIGPGWPSIHPRYAMEWLDRLCADRQRAMGAAR
ncbi:MAG: hypothetical protein V2I24_09430 [Halieaceae bacterium]|jgi:hypothetical protein|nr:hypothetical protein [Halieaceae bacterium]